MFADAAANNVRILPVLIGSPRWANWKPQLPPKDAETRRRFYQFAEAAVARYGPHGEFWRGKPYPASVRAVDWEVWNEPNLRNYWGEGRPDRLRQLRQADQQRGQARRPGRAHRHRRPLHGRLHGRHVRRRLRSGHVLRRRRRGGGRRRGHPPLHRQGDGRRVRVARRPAPGDPPRDGLEQAADDHRVRLVDEREPLHDGQPRRSGAPARRHLPPAHRPAPRVPA